MTEMPKVLDLFSGIGGLSLGFERTGFKVIGGVDNWAVAKLTFERNHRAKCMLADVATILPTEVSDFFDLSKSDVQVMVGGPPCQGFSTVGKRDSSDPRNSLWTHYLGLVDYFRPAYVVVENVEGLVVMDRGGVCEKITENFNRLGYRAKWKILTSADHGVPQLRKRVIFFAWLDRLVEPQFPSKTISKYVTVSEAIFDLPRLDSSESCSVYTTEPLTEFQKMRRGTQEVLTNHEAAKHPPHLVEILSHIPDGGNRKSIPHHLQPKSGFHNSYARLASNKPAIAVTSNMRKPSTARATHPTQNRGLTVREGLRLQTFDDSFEVLGTRTSQYLQVGNAVPPLLGEVIGKELLKAYLENAPSKISEARANGTKKIAKTFESQLAFVL